MRKAANQFKALFAKVVEMDPAELKMDTRLRHLEQWDSIAAVSLLVMMQTEYGQAVSAEDIRAAKTVGDLFKLVSHVAKNVR